MMFGSFFSAPFNPSAANGTGGFQAGAGQSGQSRAVGQNAGHAGTSPFGAQSPVFTQGFTGANTANAMGGIPQGGAPQQSDPLTQMGMASMSGDTQMLFMTLQTMMVGLMGMIAAVLAGILSGAISGKAPAGTGGTTPPGGGLPGTGGTGGDTGGSNVSSGPVGNVRTPKAGNYGGTNLNDDQVRNAATIASVGKEMGMSKKDIQTAIATAMQESTLKNIDYGDRDSVGLFQQRTSQGWGSVSDIMKPEYAARKFFEALKKQGNRDSRSVTDLAQSVQRSAFPDAYQKWAGMAGALTDAIVG